MSYLTDLQCKKVSFTKPGTILRRKEKERIGNKLNDGNGLTLVLTRTGAKLWQIRLIKAVRDLTSGRIRHIENIISIGAYPTVPLASRYEGGLYIRGARELTQLVRTWFAQGIDIPTIRARIRQDGTSPTSFESVAREWVEKQARRRDPGYRRRTLRRLEMYVFPIFGSRQILDIGPTDVLRALRPIEAKGILETAHRVKSLICQICCYAVACGLRQYDPTRDLRGALEQPVVRHFPTLIKPDDIAGLLRAILGYQGSRMTQIAMLIAIYTFVRPGNLRFSEWPEFRHLDNPEFAARHIPGPNMKRKIKFDFVVPLAPQVVKLVEELRQYTGSGKYLFPSVRSKDRPMSNNTINAALRRMGFGEDELTGHGFRAMARTICHQTLRFAPEVIEEQLAHAKAGPLGSSYDRTEFLPDRRILMNAWADWLDQLVITQAV